MVRENSKQKYINYENSIKKSNELSMAKLNQGLSLKEMQLLAYAIYSTQQDGKTTFIKADFEKKFGIEKYPTKHAKEDANRVLDLKFSIEDLENDYFEYWNVFQSIKYDGGLFSFKWTEDMIPHILELKEKYVISDLTITSQFDSGFSWTLYDYLKARYGAWHTELSKDSLMRLFGVEDRKTYQSNTGRFKKSVLDVAISEINKYTELEVWYVEKRVGNKITGFVIHWSSGTKVNAATEKQITLLREIHSEVEKNLLDYLSLEDAESLDVARQCIVAIKEFNNKVNSELSSDEMNGYIKQAKDKYLQLESLVKSDGKKRDTSFYYNWLEDE